MTVTTPLRPLAGGKGLLQGSALVFDDHAEVARLLQLRLGQLGLATRCVTDRAQFIADISREHADFIFLDLALGNTDAVEILGLLKAADFKGRIILMSGAFTLALDHVSRIGRRYGLEIAGTLKKPFRYWELQDLLAGLARPAMPLATFDGETEHGVALGDALRNGWVEFWYQPKIDLVSGQMSGAEALARIRHPELGLLRPGSIFRRASRPEMAELLIRSLDDAAGSALKLRRAGRKMAFSINVAGCTLGEPELLETMRDRRMELDGDVSIILEVTESDIVHDSFGAETFVTRALLHGFEVSIDDFGHGYATFERLRTMPFTELKLERSMVNGCANDRALENICRASARLGHDFGAKVVAEGIEREADLAMVRSLGFDMAQGYYFSSPLPFDQLEALPSGFARGPALPAQAAL